MPGGRDDRTILIAEDEPEVRSYLEMALRCQGYAVESAQNGEEVLTYLSDGSRDVSLVLLDIIMPGKDGLETLREIRRLDKELPIVMLSGTSSPLKAAEAMKIGANDFLAKPVSHDELGKAIQNALKIRVEQEVRDQPPQPPEDGAFSSGNARMKKIERALRQIAASDVPVLFQGESGVGKEILARLLHAQSPRAKKPFMKLNCAAVPSELLESELFGYERGAFTGAFKNKPGKFELADGGTLMLDEIGDMDFRLQAKLLHVLQDQEFQRLGGKETVRVNVRVVAATHCDLETAIREGRFREDLYYRINVINVQVPTLRERRDEIVPLAGFFLRKHARPGETLPEITAELKQALLAHNWPGNIRELENAMRRFLVFRDPGALAEELTCRTRRKAADAPSQGFIPPMGQTATEESEFHDPISEQLDAPHKPSETAATAIALNSTHWDCKLAAPSDAPAVSDERQLSASALETVQVTSEQLERDAILAALDSTYWNRKQAAVRLNIDYKALLYKIKKLGIESKAPSPPAPPAPPVKPADSQTGLSVLEKVSQLQRQAETELILKALTSTHWNRKRAASLLNLEYKALLYKMRKLSIGEKRFSL